MKTRIGATKGIAIVITALALASVGRAQLQEPPKLGSYYSAKDYEWKPPWPFNPHPELPAVEFAPGKFLADDTGVPDTPEQAVARKRHAKAAALAKAIAADPVLAAAAHQAAEDARRRAEEAWQQKKVALAPQTRALIPPGRAASEEKRQEGEAEFAALREQATRSAAEQPAKERALDELSKRLGTPREIQESDGRKLILVDEIAGGPAYVGSHNTAAAASISADELWPLGAWPYSESNTGRNLTGTNVTLALWETDGGVRTNHIEFGTRVRQRDNAMLDTSGHATAVAGTMAAGGVRSIFGQFYQARGVAYQANVFAYDTANFKSERESAAAGDATNAPVFLANHSWGLANGWRRHRTLTNQVGVVVTNVWVWWGPPGASFSEDPKFGLYTIPNDADIGCVQVDRFHNAEAIRHLMVYSCGNDRLEGPTNSPGTYYWLSNGVFVVSTTTRDWLDGDDGGYDSLAAPGTAKNVLTVGACEDVYWVSNHFVIFGFGPGANAVPATFSGAGPTDDGRLKPDLVAVGTPNLWLRYQLGEVSSGYILGLISPTAAAVNQYEVFAEGTSFAAPGVVGGLGLVLQRRAQLYPGLTNAADAWLNSTLKAVAIDTVDEVGAEGSDYRLGHGIFNARRAVERVEQDFNWGRGSLIKEFTLAPTQSVSWVVTSSGTEPLSVTAAWSDPPGPAITNVTAADLPDPMLVNNLDVVVEHLGTATISRPWVLNPDLTNKTAAARSAAATRGVDNRNNVERISIASPAAGEYRITVTHSGGLPGNPAPTTQKVSVVLGGATPPVPVITALEKSPTTNEFLLTFVADPGAYFTILASTNVATPLANWTAAVSVLSESRTNTVPLMSPAGVRFWRMRRGQ
ncbi:MAG TPA: S8 family serine peptidase [Verrucomicrobiota bacterium]|mgnify:CR=1 FL=1|jgi:hypothetical protein|nr:MAG: Serine protease AprX [Verrucomicrobia bacterium ADurb.Bin118]HPY30569.1 S8 family serine peptidase [Verrucomicrobiota bacterium]HQB15733.1 S8 family serine peptidase [Verrucomicrobiota bacterium]